MTPGFTQGWLDNVKTYSPVRNNKRRYASMVACLLRSFSLVLAVPVELKQVTVGVDFSLQYKEA